MATRFQIVDKLLPLVDGAFQSEEVYEWRNALALIEGVRNSEGAWASEDPKNFLGDRNLLSGVSDLADLPLIDIEAPIKGTYETLRYGVHTPLSANDLKDESDGLSAMNRAAQTVKRTVWDQIERAVATLTCSTSTPFGNDTLANFAIANPNANGNSWSGAGSDPLADLVTLYEVVRDQGNGVEPDTLHLSRDAAQALRTNASMRGFLDNGMSIAGVGDRALTFEVVRQILNDQLFGGRGKVVIFSALSNSANHALAVNAEGVAESGTCWMGKTMGYEASTINGMVKVTPVAAAVLMYEDWAPGVEDRRFGNGVDVFGEVRCGVQAMNTDLGYTLTSLL